MFYTYALKSTQNHKIYIGYTGNIEKRVIEHNSGKNPYTRYNGPWKLISMDRYIWYKDFFLNYAQ